MAAKRKPHWLKDGEGERPRHRSLWPITFGPVAWSLHFLVAYCTTAIVCAKGWDPTIAHWTVAVSAVVALAVILATGWLSWRQWDYLDDLDYEHDGPAVEDRREFLGHVGVLLAIVSAIGTVYVSLPAVFIGGCV